MAPTDLKNRLHELFRLNPSTGNLIRRVTTSPNTKRGQRAGWITECGYVRVSVDGRYILAHVIVWYFTHGAWPSQQIDHINGRRNDNRPTNLRLASNAENAQNQRRPRDRNKARVLGVSPNRSRWRATIVVNGVQINLGTFKSKKDAARVYLEAKSQLHPFATTAG